jgi:hypothetical protein
MKMIYPETSMITIISVLLLCVSSHPSLGFQLAQYLLLGACHPAIECLSTDRCDLSLGSHPNFQPIRSVRSVFDVISDEDASEG